MPKNLSSLYVLDDRKIVIIVLSIQAVFLSIFGLDWLGLGIPALREVLGFVYLTFIPGILILRLLGFDISKLNTWLYGIGISVVFLIFIGMVISLAYPLLGIQNPLSVVPSLITVSVIVILLCLLIYKRKNNTKFYLSLGEKKLLSPYPLFLLLLPFLTAIGGFFIQYHTNNIPMIILLILIALIPVFVVYNKLPERFFPLAIFVIFLSLLYHNSLSIPYFFGRDIQIEYYYANLVSLNSCWNPNIESQINSLLGDVLLSTIYSKILGVSLTWIFKLLYPLLFSFSLVALYQALKQQLDEKMVFLSCFFFASIEINYEEFLTNIKQLMTVFFISLLVLLMVDRNFKKRPFLSIPFILGLITSHYGTPYIFLFSSFAVLIFVTLSKRLKRFEIEKPLTTINFVLLSALLTLSWFIYTSGGINFDLIVRLSKTIANSIMEFFSPLYRGGVYYLTIKLPSWEWEVLRLLHIMTDIFILSGFLYVLYEKLKLKNKSEENHIQNEYFLYSATFLGWLAASVITPVIVGGPSLGTPRIYILSMIFLTPFCIIGGKKIITSIYKLFDKFKNNMDRTKSALKILAIFFMVFLLFNTRLIMEVNQEIFDGNGYVASLSISQPRIMKGDAPPREIAGFFREYNSHLDVYGAKWLKEHKNEGEKVIIDFSPLVPVYVMIPLNETISCTNMYSFTKNVREKQQIYVYLRESNIKYNLMSSVGIEEYWSTSEILPILEAERNKVYANGGSVIYK